MVSGHDFCLPQVFQEICFLGGSLGAQCVMIFFSWFCDDFWLVVSCVVTFLLGFVVFLSAGFSAPSPRHQVAGWCHGRKELWIIPDPSSVFFVQ